MKKIILFLRWLLACIMYGFYVLLSIRKNLSKPNMTCNRGNKEEFRDCLNQNIPIGSSYEELRLFLSEHGFGYTPNQPDKNNRFNFFWSANDLGNYKIAVIGLFDSELKVIEMEVI
ncbi:hypothetical protein [Crocosphaera chwakensis]|nr:hypothetical protein [Crocosphaera chwakensis]